MKFNLPIIASAMLAVLALANSAAADPGPIHYLDAAEFHALGPIDQVTNFDSFTEGGPTLVANQYFEGDLYIYSPQNIVVGKGMDPFFPVRNSILNNQVGDLSIVLTEPGYNLLSLRLGRLVGNGAVTLDLFTTQGIFSSTYAVFPANEGFKFHGFSAPAGDYFTGVLVRGVEDTAAIAVAEIEIGRMAAVPEPSAWALLILGFGGTGAMLRRRRYALA
jgi:hypothetical protein